MDIDIDIDIDIPKCAPSYSILFKRRNSSEIKDLNCIYGGGILMIYFPFGSMERRN